jgi:hypothetical protein
MAQIFTVVDNSVIPKPEVLLISPFKEIWKRDKDRFKKLATKEFTYIEFMTSILRSNPFSQYEESKKSKAIIAEVFQDDVWKPDKLVMQGVESVIKFNTEYSTTYNYYMSNKIAAEKMQNFFKTVDITKEFNERTGAPLYKPKDITSALKDAEEVISKLKVLEAKVQEEIIEETRTKSNKEISPFANPNSLR